MSAHDAQYNRRRLKRTDLANVRKRCAAAPLDDGVHELDLERLDVVVLVDRQLGLLGDLRNPPRDLLHDA